MKKIAGFNPMQSDRCEFLYGIEKVCGEMQFFFRLQYIRRGTDQVVASLNINDENALEVLEDRHDIRNYFCNIRQALVRSIVKDYASLNGCTLDGLKHDYLNEALCFSTSNQGVNAKRFSGLLAIPEQQVNLVEDSLYLWSMLQDAYKVELDQVQSYGEDEVLYSKKLEEIKADFAIRNQIAINRIKKTLAGLNYFEQRYALANSFLMTHILGDMNND